MAMIKMLKYVFIRMDGQYKQEVNSVGSQGKLGSKSTTTETKDSYFNKLIGRSTKFEE